MPPPARTAQRPSARVSSRGRVPAAALLPLRAFFGFTFLYAGLDKLAFDPTFLDLTSRTSILSQLRGYEHSSPLAPLISALAIPNAWLFGVLIAIAEIGVGLGILSGLAFRLSAAGGALLSFLFFLTASWTVRPYYFGQDLPYLLGFVTLAAAGHGDLYVLGPWLERTFLSPAPAYGRRAEPVPASPERRFVLQVGVLAIAAIALAIVARPLRALIPFGDDAVSRRPLEGLGGTSALPGSSAPAASAGPSSAPAASAATGSQASANALAIGSAADVAKNGAAQFTVPDAVAAKDSTGQVQAGDPGIVVALGSGSFVAFDAVCTHAGCTVEWDPQAGYLVCPCHGGAFDVHNKAQPVAGPPQVPLAQLPIAIEKGVITLKA